MDMLNTAGTETIRAAVLLGLSGILGEAAGNSSMVVSIYSPETTTGKSLALYAVNSLIGSPKKLLMCKDDTANALYKIRGILNNLPCTMDELTTVDDKTLVEMAYALSQGREKRAMDKNRNLRTPVMWNGPTFISTNVSLIQKYEAVQTNSDPLRARTLEIPQHDRTFISGVGGEGRSRGELFFDRIDENNGWAFPELVEAISTFGGPLALLNAGRKRFATKFNIAFEEQERFYRTGIINAWVMGTLAKKIGLIPFDIDTTIQHILDHVETIRDNAVLSKQDVFDTLGQFLQENNDKLIEVTEEYGSHIEQVRLPAPEKAVARIKVVYDTKTAVLPGSQLAVNLAVFKTWLGRTRDSIDRVERELSAAGALVSKRERITMFKGCSNRNPGQAHCLIVNINHPRFIAALTSDTARVQSPVALAVLQGGQ